MLVARMSGPRVEAVVELGIVVVAQLLGAVAVVSVMVSVVVSVVNMVKVLKIQVSVVKMVKVLKMQVGD